MEHSIGRRAIVWNHLQIEQPGAAWMLTEVRRVFGKTPTPTITLGGRVVWSPAVALRRKHGS